MHFPQLSKYKIIPDLLHHVIKDHVTEWVQQWLVYSYSKSQDNRILISSKMSFSIPLRIIISKNSDYCTFLWLCHFVQG